MFRHPYSYPFTSHLLHTTYRDIKDTTVGTLSQRITNQVHGLKGLNSKLLDIRSYLERVTAGKLPINHQIIYQLQDVFNLLPDVNLLVSCLSLRGIEFAFIYNNYVGKLVCFELSFHLILSDICKNVSLWAGFLLQQIKAAPVTHFYVILKCSHMS